MKIEEAIRIGLGISPISLTTAEEALTVMATELEMMRTQEPVAIVDRVHGQMCLQFVWGKTIYDMPVGMKLYAHPMVALKHSHEKLKIKDDLIANLEAKCNELASKLAEKANVQAGDDKPKQTSRYDWSKAPEWAMWAATEQNGNAWFYNDKPREHPKGWVMPFKHGAQAARCWNLNVSAIADWRNSLEQRPVANKSRYDWSKAPEWAMWAAVIYHRLVRYFEHKPKMGDEFWLNTNGGKYSDMVCDSAVLSDWQSSLEQRPQSGVELVHPKLPPVRCATENDQTLLSQSIRYIETNAHVIDLRRVQCVSVVDENGGYQVTLVSGVVLPVDNKLYSRETFLQRLIAYGEEN